MKKLLISLTLAALIVGCSTPTGTAIKTEGVTVTTVDTGMKGWAMYVNQHLTDGKVTQKELDTVKNAYNIYYTAQLSAEAALETIVTSGSTNTVDLTTANTSVMTAETQLLTLINQYLNQ
jgi:hypothetical protein